METRANHLLIGAFVLAMVAGAFGFTIWLAKVQIDREFDRYHVFIDGSVAGLTTAGEVLYNGISVGSVREIIIDPGDPRRVRVTVEVASTTPVREDTVASLELQGITGVSYINLSGGKPESAPLLAREGQELPVISSRPSRFEELFTGAPEALNRIIVLINQMAGFLDEDNRVAIAGILADMKGLTGTFAGRADRLGKTLDNIEQSSAELREAAANVRRFTLEVEGLVQSVDATLTAARGTLGTADQTLAEAASSVRGIGARAEGLLGSAQATLETARGTLGGVDATLAAARGTLGGADRTLAEAAASVKGIGARAEGVLGSAQATLETARGTLGGVDATLTVARSTLGGADEIMANDLRHLFQDTRETVRSMARTSDEIQALIAENREPFGEFSSGGLIEFSRLVTEARFLVSSLSRLAERLESDPAQFLFGDREQGFKAE